VSVSPLVQAIQERLRSGGYSDLSTPFKVAGVEFAFTGAMRGRDGRALDLVLLVDTTTGDFGDRDGGRVRQRVEALSRALDVTGSRYVVTVILAGAVLAQGIEALSETCRVLQVEGVALDDEGKPADETANASSTIAFACSCRSRFLLRAESAGWQRGPAMDQLVRALQAGMEKALVDKVIAASSDGEQAVTDAVVLLINGAFQSEPGREQA
jgi:hypothetical protein